MNVPIRIVFFRRCFLFIVVFTISAGVLCAQKSPSSEADLKKQAERQFNQHNYASATPLYSQLLSLYPKSPDYNYRYGVCLLLSSKDKATSVSYLENASSNPKTEEEVFFYLGKAYMLTNNYNAALSAFEKFKKQAATKAKKLEVDLFIDNCVNAKEFSKNKRNVVIINQQQVNINSFYTSYVFENSSGKILVTPERFLTSLDKEKIISPVMFLTKDGQTIYYSSYGKRVERGKDIYSIKKLPDGSWGQPVELGDVINTDHDEDFPFLDEDGKTLYFSSKGHNNMGGYDIFKSVYDAVSGSWSSPENLGIPINTTDDDLVYVQSSKGDYAQYASTIESEQGKIGVRKIKLGDVVEKLTIINGHYFSKDQPQRRDAKISVIRIKDNGLVMSVRTDPRNGNYQLEIPAGEDYTLVVEAGGYLAHAENFTLPAGSNEFDLKQDVRLTKNSDVERLTLSNYFSVDKNLPATVSNEPTNVVSNEYRINGDQTKLKPIDINGRTVYVTPPKNSGVDESSSVNDSPKEPNVTASEKKDVTSTPVNNPNETQQEQAIKKNSVDESKPEHVAENKPALKSNDGSKVPSSSSGVTQPVNTKPSMETASSIDSKKKDSQTKDVKEVPVNPQSEKPSSNNKAVSETTSVADPKKKDAPTKDVKEVPVNSQSPQQPLNEKKVVTVTPKTESGKKDSQKPVETKNDATVSNETKDKSPDEKVISENVSNKELVKMAFEDARTQKEEATVLSTNAENTKQLAQEQDSLSKSQLKEAQELLKSGTPENKEKSKQLLKDAEDNKKQADARFVKAKDLADEAKKKNEEADESLADATLMMTKNKIDTSSSKIKAEPLLSKTATTQKNESTVINHGEGNLQESSSTATKHSATEAKSKTEDDQAQTKQTDKKETASDVNQTASAKNKSTGKKEENDKSGMETYSSSKTSDSENTADEKPTVSNSEKDKPGTSEISTQPSSPKSSTANTENNNAHSTPSSEKNKTGVAEKSDHSSSTKPSTRDNGNNDQHSTPSVSETNKITTKEKSGQSSSKPSTSDIGNSDQHSAPSVSETNGTTTKEKSGQSSSKPSTSDIGNSDQHSAPSLSENKKPEVKEKSGQPSSSIPSTSDVENNNQHTAPSASGNSKTRTKEKSVVPVISTNPSLVVSEKAKQPYKEHKQLLSESKTASDEAEELQGKVNFMPESKQRDSLISRSNDLNVLSIKKWQDAQTKLNEAKKNDPDVEEKMLTIEKNSPPENDEDNMAQSLPKSTEPIKESVSQKNNGAIAVNDRKSTVDSQRSTVDNKNTTKAVSQPASPVKSSENKTETKIPDVPIDTSSPSYPEYAATREQIVTKQTETINVFAEAIRFNKLAQQKKEEEIAIRDKAVVNKDSKEKFMQLKEADATKKTADSLTFLSQEKFRAAQKITNEFAGLNTKASVLREKMSPTVSAQPKPTETTLAKPESKTAQQDKAVTSAKVDSSKKPELIAWENKPSAKSTAKVESKEPSTNNTIQPKNSDLASTTKNTTSEKTVEQKATNTPLEKNSNPEEKEIVKPKEAPSKKREELKTEPVAIVTTSPDKVNPVILKEDVTIPNEKIFNLSKSPVYNKSNPIPMDPALPDGLVFKVQIGAFHDPLPYNAFKNVQPVTGETTRPGWIRYCVGLFKAFEPANIVKAEMKSMGYKDAYVVAYYNGKRIELSEAYSMIRKSGIQEKELYASNSTNETSLLHSLKISASKVNDRNDEDANSFYNASPDGSGDNTGAIEYAVQVGVYKSAKVPKALIPLMPLHSEIIQKGLYRFLTGRYSAYASADSTKRMAITTGVKDAFIVKYKNGNGSTVNQTNREKKENESSVPVNVKSQDATVTSTKPETTSASVTSGLIYKVQIGAFRQKLTESALDNFQKISSNSISNETTPSGLQLYYSGSFTDLNSALFSKNVIAANGIKDAFVVAFSDGKKIPVNSSKLAAKK